MFDNTIIEEKIDEMCPECTDEAKRRIFINVLDSLEAELSRHQHNCLWDEDSILKAHLVDEIEFALESEMNGM